MLFEETEAVEQELNELDTYLQENPDDYPALLFGAFCEDKERWANSVKTINIDLQAIQLEIETLEQRKLLISKMQNFWRKIFNKTQTVEALERQIEDLKEMEFELQLKLEVTALSPPEPWRYKLGATGNTLFKVR